MGMIWTSKTRTRQPQGAIKPAAGLPLAYLGGTHNGWRNFANVAPTIPSGWSVTTDRFGIANACDGASTMAVSGQGLATDRKSIVILFKTGATASAFGVVMSLDDAGGANSPARIQYDASGVSLVYTVRDSVGNYQTPTLIASPALNTWYCVALSDNQASGVRVSINGSAAQSIAGYAKQYVIVAGLYVGGYGGSGANWTGKVALIGWSNNLLSDFQLQAYAANPWQLFAPEQTPKFYSLPAATSSGMIWTSKTRTRQPSGPVGINRSNPVSRQIIDSLLFSNGIPINVARTSSTISKTGTPVTEITSKGVASYLSAGASWNITSSTNYAAGDFTIRCVVMFRAFGSYATLIDKDNGAGFREIAFFLDTSGNINYIGIGGVNNTDSVSLGLSLNVLYDIVITRVGSTVAFYVDGRFKGNPTLPYSGTTGSANPLVLARNSSGGGVNTNAVFLSFDTWSRGLSSPEINSLYQNPWQLYVPEKRPLFFSTGGGGGGAGTKILIPYRRVWTRQPR